MQITELVPSENIVSTVEAPKAVETAVVVEKKSTLPTPPAEQVETDIHTELRRKMYKTNLELMKKSRPDFYDAIMRGD